MDDELYRAVLALKIRMDEHWQDDSPSGNAALTWADIRELWPPIGKALSEHKAILDGRARAWP